MQEFSWGIKEVVIIYSTDDFIFLARKGMMGKNMIFTGQLSQIEDGASSSKGFAGSSSTECDEVRWLQWKYSLCKGCMCFNVLLNHNCEPSLPHEMTR